jgi:tripartite ATP-independent transporter DctP family solute receptor
MSSSRQTFIASSAAFATIGILRRPADAAEFTYKLGFDEPLSHPMTIRANEAAQKIKLDSGGRLEIQVFPNSQLGDDTAMISQVRLGALHMTLMSDGILSGVVPLAAIENVTFAFSNYKQAFEAMDGPLGANVRAAIAKAGLYPFEKIWCSGFKQVTNSVRLLNSPADFKGLKFRVPPSAMEVALFKAVDASAVPINLNEAYAAMQSHLVDGASLPIVTVETLKFYEVQKYIAITNHLFTGYSVVANGEAWQALPKDLRELTERHFNAAGLLERTDIENLDAMMESKLKSQGMQVTHPDSAAFRRDMRSGGFYKGWREQFGSEAWALLEKSVGGLT